MIEDIEGRTVSYTYSGDNLHTLTNLRGYATAYGYSGGKLSRIEEPGGKVRNIIYGPYGDVAKVTDGNGARYLFEFDYNKGTREYYSYVKYPSGKVKEVWYDYHGDTKRVDISGVTVKKISKDGERISYITDERGYISKKVFDEWENLIHIEHPDGTWETYSYNKPWNRVVEHNRMGIITRYDYDGHGYRTAMTEAVGTAVEWRSEYVYNEHGQLLATTSKGESAAEDAATTFSYDENGNLETITDGEGNTTIFSDYTATGNPQTVEDGRGYRKYFTYDEAGNLRTIRDHDRELMREFSYDVAGNRISVIDAYLNEYNFTFDQNNNLLTVTDPLSNTSERSYTRADKVKLIIDPSGHRQTLEYDAFERLAKVTDGEGNVTTYTYESSDGCVSCAGNSDLVAEISYPTFTRTFKYNSMKRLIRQTDLLADEHRTTRYAYDDYGNMTTMTDPTGRISEYRYDALGRKILERNSLGEETAFTYDGRDNLTVLKDDNDGLTLFFYDRNNRLIRESKPLRQETFYSYDKAGNLEKTVTALGRKTLYSYDSDNRLTMARFYNHVDDTTPAKTVRYSYNDAGSLTGYNDGTTSAVYTYDALQRKRNESVAYGPFTLSHAYDYYANGLKKSYTGLNGTTRSYSYDKANRPTAMLLPNGKEITFTGYIWNRPEHITFPGVAQR